MNKSYYVNGRKYKPVDVINDWDLGFNLGNALKYIARVGRKGDAYDAVCDIDKAIDYLQYERKLWLHKRKEEIKNEYKF